MRRDPVGMNELAEHWIVPADERDVAPDKRGGPSRLGFALLLLLGFLGSYGEVCPGAGPVAFGATARAGGGQ